MQCRSRSSVEIGGERWPARPRPRRTAHRLCPTGARPVAASAVAISALIGFADPAYGEPLADVPITYAAPDGCPQVEVFRQELAARLLDTSPEAWRGFAFWVRVLGDDAGYVARLHVIDPKGEDIDREVRDPQCREVVRAVAFVAAVLVDPNAAARTPAAEDETPPSSGALPPVPASPAPPPPPPARPVPRPASTPPPAAPPTPVAGEPAPASVSGLATLGLTVHSAVSKRAVFGPRFGLGVHYGHRWGAAAHLSVARAQSGQLDGDIGTAELTWTAARADLCAAFRPHPDITLLPCLLTEIGELRGDGTDADSHTDRAALWLAPGAMGRLVVGVVGPLGAYVEAGTVVPIVKPHFYFLSPDGRETVHRVPGQGFFSGAGLALEFP